MTRPALWEIITAIERAVPKGAASGDRYPAAQLAHLDSERPHGETG